MMNLHLTKGSHTSCLFCNSLWRGIEKEKCSLSGVLGSDVMFISRDKCHLLPVINPMKFVETLFQIIGCSNFLLFTELYLMSCANLMSPTFFKHVRCGMKQCSITHSLSTWDCIDDSSYNDGLTHLLLVTWYTPHFLKIKIESCHSLCNDLT